MPGPTETPAWTKQNKYGRSGYAAQGNVGAGLWRPDFADVLTAANQRRRMRSRLQITEMPALQTNAEWHK